MTAVFGHVPEAVLQVCERLRGAGHEAYAVGGAVRDAVLGRDAQDWDVTTSARPDEVTTLFRRTIPTGIAHGTVTVLCGRGKKRRAIEVTTFRSEGAYTDARHPDSVTFGVSLEDDLSRRDFTINAIALDPLAKTLVDPFDGAGDIARRVVRAVGDPAARLSEDGLRILRAIRFVAVLRLALDEATAAAIPGALFALAKVSAERITVELEKLVVGADARAALKLGAKLGVWQVAAPAIAEVAADDAAWERALARFENVPADPPLRLAALIGERGVPAAKSLAKRLKLKNIHRDRLTRTVRELDTWREIDSDAAARRFVSRVGRKPAADVAALWRAEATARKAAAAATAAASLIESAAASTDPVAISELAISGADVMRIAAIEPGPAIGQILSHLLEHVLDDPSQNTPAQLTALVQQVATKR